MSNTAGQTFSQAVHTPAVIAAFIPAAFWPAPAPGEK